MLRIHIDSNVIAAELKAEGLRLAIRRQRALDRERTFIFSEGVSKDANGALVATRSRGVHGDSMAEELADKAAEFKAALKAMAAAEMA